MPSLTVARSATTAKPWSSLRITPSALPSTTLCGVPSPRRALPRLTLKVSSASTTRSPLTRMVRVLLASPAAKLRVPVLASKSAALAMPARDQSTSAAEPRSPARVTVKVKAVVPL